MCLDCAKKRLAELFRTEGRDSRARGGIRSDRFFLCCLDHDDHVHIRFNWGQDHRSEWHQLPCRLEELRNLLPRTMRVHVHEEPGSSVKPATAEVIAALGRAAKEYVPADDKETTCAICHSDFANGDKCNELPCKHLFHHDCLLQWMERADTCPSCRSELTDEASILGELSSEWFVEGNGAGAAEGATSDAAKESQEQAQQSGGRLTPTFSPPTRPARRPRRRGPLSRAISLLSSSSPLTSSSNSRSRLSLPRIRARNEGNME